MKLPRRLALFACAVALVSAAAPAADWEAMPPKEADALTSTQITDLKIWIAGGAPWPDAARQKVIAASSAEKWSAEDGVTVPTSGGLSADWTNRRYKPDGLWGYQPVKKPAVPAAASIENPKSKIEKPIDAFIAARLPTAAELEKCLAHWRDIARLIAHTPPAPAARPPLELRRDAVEENTGEKFSFQEKLHAAADFVPDLAPADVTPRVRALADVCLTLFNTNEFSYVD